MTKADGIHLRALRQPVVRPGPGSPAPGARHDVGKGSRLALRVGSWVALLMSALTLVTFALAFNAPPPDELAYPFTSELVVGLWPGDYLWMGPAMLLMLVFLAFVTSVHDYAPPSRRFFGRFSLCLALMATVILLSTYFVQVTVMPTSLDKGQLDGWSMLTMYNPNGVFIALEELAYLLMALSLAVLAPVFVGTTGVDRAIRGTVVVGFSAAVIALVGVSVARGADRGWLYEVIVISIVWTTLVVVGPLVAVVLRRAAAQPDPAVTQ